MTKPWLLTAILLLSSVWAVAQDTSQAANSNSSQTSSSASETTIEGCLSGSAGNYSLTDTSGKTYQLQGDNSKFSDQIGHQVRIKGTTAASASATTPSGATASASTSGSGNNPSPSSANNPTNSKAGSPGSASAAIQFNVASIEKISDSCTAPPTSK
jgi:hypothetical protein